MSSLKGNQKVPGISHKRLDIHPGFMINIVLPVRKWFKRVYLRQSYTLGKKIVSLRLPFKLCLKPKSTREQCGYMYMIIYKPSSCTYLQSSCPFLFKLQYVYNCGWNGHYSSLQNISEGFSHFAVCFNGTWKGNFPLFCNPALCCKKLYLWISCHFLCSYREAKICLYCL